MDDLISREAAIETVKKLLYETAFNSCGHHQDDEIYADIAEHRIDVWLGLVSSVPAVPLDKLCLLLHDIEGCPCYTQPGEDMCNRLIGDQCNTEWDDIECWKRFLTKWMEGQDATD